MTSLSALLASMSRDGDQFSISPTEDWGQGRTLYGGITLALAAHAVRRAFPELPPMRSAQAAFTGPASGPLTIHPAVVSAGKSSAFVGVDSVTAAGVALRATFCYGVARNSAFRHVDIPMPDVARPAQCGPFFPTEFTPQFAVQFEARLAGKHAPLAGIDDPDLLAWIRHRDQDVANDEAGLIALADATPPSATLMFTEASPISTMTWSMEFLGTDYRNDGWHLIRSKGEDVGDGYCSQAMNVWDEHGRPLIAARQSVSMEGYPCRRVEAYLCRSLPVFFKIPSLFSCICKHIFAVSKKRKHNFATHNLVAKSLLRNLLYGKNYAPDIICICK